MKWSGVFDGFDWNTHPALFGYAATLATLMWVIWRLLITIERLLDKRKAPHPEDEGPSEGA